MTNIIKIAGKEYPVRDYIENKQGQKAPLVELPMMSDYKWQLSCLNSRLNNPEIYRETGEDVEAVIKKLRQWLKDHEYMNNEKEKALSV
jgi:hypothetical protein